MDGVFAVPISIEAEGHFGIEFFAVCNDADVARFIEIVAGPVARADPGVLVVDDHLMEITHVIRGEEWLYFLYKNYTHGQKEADFDIESLTNEGLVVSWTNRFSESTPFFEKFYLQRID